MSSINNIDTSNNTRHAAPIDRAQRSSQAVTPDQSNRTPDSVDQVQLSDHARWLDRLRDLPVRSDLVDRIKSEIAAGTFDIDARIDQAANALANDLAL
ncbi:MAG: flagellar biosynthesis anti-sigma factor FlgM [Phycisphaerales bacterium]|nr:flagellar biosynthesis anti-sigma factor FlgM [Phycisphaerales bacterium]